MIDKNEKNPYTGLEVAVIGMAGRFPGAKNIDEFWENLKNGIESITLLSEEEILEMGVSPKWVKDPTCVKTKGGVLEDKEYFDVSFFRYTPNEALVMDPQYRVFHQCAWEALEHAGYNPGIYKGLIGIYAGCTDNFDWQARVSLMGKAEQMGSFGVDSLLHRDYLCTRISYKFNLKGPAVVIQTACSTSLVAVHTACRALITSECDMALAGGVKISPLENRSYLYIEGMISSKDGHCRAFDADATGTAVGDGIGIVVLKRLKHALNEGDTIHAIIKATAINNDGIEKIGYTAPGMEGQTGVIKKALRLSKASPESITYIECHGTGTPLGDRIEIEALKRAFNTDKKGYCRIGSVKTNVGHLDAAAGVTSLIKTVLALKKRMIPPSLHLEKPNPEIDFENSPFYVNKELSQWRRENENYPLRAGVSSFGIGGTNAHAVLEEFPGSTRGLAPLPYETQRAQEPGENQLILLSAKTQTALDKMTGNLTKHFKRNPGINLADAAYTLQEGRKSFEYRKILLGNSVEEVYQALSDPGSPAVQTAFTPKEKQLIFMFPGQGSQYVNMGRELYQKEHLFRQEMDRCFEILKPLMGYDIKEILYPGDAVSELSEETPAVSNMSYMSNINQTGIAQPMLFAIEYALARLLMEWGLEPLAMIGHSIGEYAAACLAGVFSLADALKIVVLRGKSMQQMPGGDMLSVPLSEKELLPLLKPNQHENENHPLELAAVNAPDHCVVSGSKEAIESFAQQLEKKGTRVRRLHTSHAFHSRTMEPILKEFKEAVARISLNKPKIPYISNLTGSWITVEEVLEPGYWARHLRKTVRFADGLTQLLKKQENAILVEVGPGRALTTFARQHPGKKPGHKAIETIRHPKEKVSDSRFLMEKIGQLWLYGKSIDWTRIYRERKCQRIPLPTYPFETRRFWIDEEIFQTRAEKDMFKEQRQGRLNPEERFYIPSWKRSVIPGQETQEKKAPASAAGVNWLVFGIGNQGNGNGRSDITGRVKEHLEKRGCTVIEVQPGEGYKKYSDNPYMYTIDPGEPGDYDTLLEELRSLGHIPQKIAHFWNTAPGNHLDLGFYNLVYLAQAVGRRNFVHEMEWTVVSSNMQEVTGDDELVPEKATLLGPVMIIPVEYPNIRCRSIDVKEPTPGTREETMLIRQLAAELSTPPAEVETQIAFRGNHRLVRTFEPVILKKPPSPGSWLREGGVYLVTGGLGGIGGVMARYLAQQAGAKLVLTGRTTLPAPAERNQWLTTHPVHHPVSLKIQLLRDLEEMGAQIAVYSADVTDRQQMQQVITAAEARFGPINGVIHCAGIPGAGMIQRKTREQAEQVLLPKVKGTRVLDSLLAEKPLDFFVMCSSINSVVSRVGQVDYCAANAFLDAFAAGKTSNSSTFTVSINWDAWLEVGMAEEAAKQWSGAAEVGHPLLDQFIQTDPHHITYMSYFRLDTHWVLNEHMTNEKKGLVPGVSYLEMAAAAFAHLNSTGSNQGQPLQPLELQDVNFLNLLTVSPGETKQVTMELEKNENENVFRFTIKSRLSGGEERWQNHAAGKIAPLEKETGEPPAYDIQALLDLANEETLAVPETTDTDLQPENNQQQRWLVIGPRWENLKHQYYTNTQGWALLELDETYRRDLEFYRLHPALLDMATAFMYTYVSPGSPYIPLSYKRLRVFRPLPQKILCSSQWIETEEKQKEFLRFNITIMDETGKTCIEIEEFTMIKLSEEIFDRINIKKELPTAAAPPAALTETRLTDGILPEEGIDAFNRILNGTSTRVVVSTRELLAEIKRSNRPGGQQPEDIPGSGSPKGPRYSRPEISTRYITPGNQAEQQMADTWKEVLGLSDVGIIDNFFELGGDSLKAAVITNRIMKNTKANITLAEFLNRPTIKGLIEYIEGSAGETGETGIQKDQKTKKIKDYNEIEKAIFNQFKPGSTSTTSAATTCRFKKFIVKKKIYRVLFVEERLLNKKHELLEFLDSICHKKVFPHYVGAISKLTGEIEKTKSLAVKTFDKLLDLRAYQPGVEDPHTLIINFKHQQKEYEESILKNKPVKKFPLGSTQKLYFEAHSRILTFNYELNVFLNINRLKQAIARIVKEQGMLRNILIRENQEVFNVQYDNAVELSIPYIDLSGFSFFSREEFEKELEKESCSFEFDKYGGLLYKILIIKRNQRSCDIKCWFDHLISDGISAYILGNTIRKYYDFFRSNPGEVHKKENVNSYDKYLEIIEQGPKNITGEELIKAFDINLFRESYMNISRVNKDKPCMRMRPFNIISFFKLEMKAFSTVLSENELYEKTLLGYLKFCKNYLNITGVPFYIVANSRKYRHTSFFDTIGVFVDYIFETAEIETENPRDIFNRISKKKELISKHNINFQSLKYNDTLRTKWEETSDFLREVEWGTKSIHLKYNFVGKVDKVEDVYREQDNKDNGVKNYMELDEKSGRLEISIVVFYDSESVGVKVRMTLDDEIDKLNEGLAREIEKSIVNNE